MITRHENTCQSASNHSDQRDTTHHPRDTDRQHQQPHKSHSYERPASEHEKTPIQDNRPSKQRTLLPHHGLSDEHKPNPAHRPPTNIHTKDSDSWPSHTTIEASGSTQSTHSRTDDRDPAGETPPPLLPTPTTSMVRSETKEANFYGDSTDKEP